MRLDRNSGRGKYALLNLRRLEEIRAWDGGDGEVADRRAVEDAIALLERARILEWCDKPETEFFAIKLRDRFAARALFEYAKGAHRHDPEYAADITSLAKRSGPYHPLCKLPD